MQTLRYRSILLLGLLGLTLGGIGLWVDMTQQNHLLISTPSIGHYAVNLMILGPKPELDIHLMVFNQWQGTMVEYAAPVIPIQVLQFAWYLGFAMLFVWEGILLVRILRLPRKTRPERSVMQ